METVLDNSFMEFKKNILNFIRETLRDVTNG